MQHIKKNWSIRLTGLILLFWVTTSMMSTQAMPLSDSIDDIWAQQTQTKGNFMDSIDIVQVSTQGSMVTIESKGLITASPDMNLQYYVLFSDDGDPTDWEAAIMLSYHSPEDHEVYWVVADQMAYPTDFWTIEPECIGWWGHCNAWSEGFEDTHYMIHENQVIFYFVEFPGIFGAELLCVTMAVVMTATEPEVYYDWTPNFYEFKRHFKVSTPPPAEVTTTPTTTLPISSEPTTTLPISSEPTTTTSEEPVTSHTETKPVTSTEEITTPLDSTSPSSTPGFETLSLLAALPILTWLRKRVHKK